MNEIDSVMVFLSTIGNVGAVWIGIGLLLFARKSTRQAGIYTLLAIGMAGILQDLLKEWFARPRPVINLERLLIQMPSSYSFPSGHTLISFSAAATIFSFMPRIGLITLVMALLVGISRVYLGVHFISDVLFGALIGIGIAYGLMKFKQWNQGRNSHAKDSYIQK